MGRRKMLSLELLAVAALVTGCGARSPRSGSIASPKRAVVSRAVHPCEAGLGPFAGYVGFADLVTSLSATWVVPTIDASSRAGRAATWIGAQAPGASGVAPFIQIGTNEEDSELESSSDTYYAFWSDTAHHFHPVELFPVVPGNRVSASIRLSQGRWTLTIRDASLRETKRLMTDQETTGTFNEAEYLQEDVTNGRTGTPFSYPTLSPVRFSRLTFNGKTARDGEVESQWMSVAAGHSVGPGPVADAAFSVGPRMLSAAACRYLDVVAPLNRAWARLRALGLTSSVPQLRAATDAFSAQINMVDTALARSPWPTAARRPIQALINASRRVQHFLPSLPHNVNAGVVPWETAFAQAETADTTAAREVRRALRAPELS